MPNPPSPHQLLDPDNLARLADVIPPSGEVPYRTRVSIRHALATESEDALLRLETLCAHRVLPVWQRAFPDNIEPVRLTEQVRESPDAPGLESMIGVFDTKLDEVLLLGEQYFPAASAGHAFSVLARDIAFGFVNEPDDPEGEIHIDPLTWTVCFYASVAEAGGATWEPVGNVERRREFWRWYLLEAVPQAYEH